MKNILNKISTITTLLKFIISKPYANEHAARMHDPSGYDKFSRKNTTTGVDMIIGWKGNKSEVQAVRFDSQKFTPEEAKQWMKDHEMKYISFEGAKK
jgi:hypothetical protein